MVQSIQLQTTIMAKQAIPSLKLPFTLPPQKQMEIAQRKKIIIDEHSGKILVDDDLVNEETEKMQEVIKFN